MPTNIYKKTNVTSHGANKTTSLFAAGIPLLVTHKHIRADLFYMLNIEFDFISMWNIK